MPEVEKMVINSNNPEMIYILLCATLIVFVMVEIIQIFVIKHREKRLKNMKRLINKKRRHK